MVTHGLNLGEMGFFQISRYLSANSLVENHAKWKVLLIAWIFVCSLQIYRKTLSRSIFGEACIWDFFSGRGGGVKGKKKPFVLLNKPKHQKLIGCLLRSNFGNHVKFQKWEWAWKFEENCNYFCRYIDPSPFVDSLGLDTAQQQVF